jgi:hypothetical protein
MKKFVLTMEQSLEPISLGHPITYLPAVVPSVWLTGGIWAD